MLRDTSLDRPAFVGRGQIPLRTAAGNVLCLWGREECLPHRSKCSRLRVASTPGHSLRVAGMRWPAAVRNVVWEELPQAAFVCNGSIYASGRSRAPDSIARDLQSNTLGPQHFGHFRDVFCRATSPFTQ